MICNLKWFGKDLFQLNSKKKIAWIINNFCWDLYFVEKWHQWNLQSNLISQQIFLFLQFDKMIKRSNAYSSKNLFISSINTYWYVQNVHEIYQYSDYWLYWLSDLLNQALLSISICFIPAWNHHKVQTSGQMPWLLEGYRVKMLQK